MTEKKHSHAWIEKVRAVVGDLAVEVIREEGEPADVAIDTGTKHRDEVVVIDEQYRPLLAVLPREGVDPRPTHRKVCEVLGIEPDPYPR